MKISTKLDVSKQYRQFQSSVTAGFVPTLMVVRENRTWPGKISISNLNSFCKRSLNDCYLVSEKCAEKCCAYEAKLHVL